MGTKTVALVQAFVTISYILSHLGDNDQNLSKRWKICQKENQICTFFFLKVEDVFFLSSRIYNYGLSYDTLWQGFLLVCAPKVVL